MNRAFFLALLALAACDNFDAVQQADTIQAYEAYLGDNPEGRYAMQATMRLEELMLEKAKADGTKASFDAYFARFPEGVHHKAAQEAQEDALFTAAEAAGTPAAWQAFLDVYPTKAKKGRVNAAKAGLAATTFAQELSIGEVRIEGINLAEDPEGPINGKGFFADVVNNSDKTVTSLWFRLAFLDASGATVAVEKWPLVAPRFPVPIEEEYLQPFEPGATRTWTWTDGEFPETWSGKVRLTPTKVVFAE